MQIRSQIMTVDDQPYWLNRQSQFTISKTQQMTNIDKLQNVVHSNTYILKVINYKMNTT